MQNRLLINHTKYCNISLDMYHSIWTQVLVINKQFKVESIGISKIYGFLCICVWNKFSNSFRIKHFLIILIFEINFIISMQNSHWFWLWNMWMINDAKFESIGNINKYGFRCIIHCKNIWNYRDYHALMQILKFQNFAWHFPMKLGLILL